MNIELDDHTPDTLGPGWAEVQFNIYPYLERRRVLHVILPKEAAQAIEEEILKFAKAHGKIKFWAEETTKPAPAGTH